MTRTRITLADAASTDPAAENRAFRAAVVRARQNAVSTGVYAPNGYLMAVIMPVTKTTREDAEARAAHAAAGPDIVPRVAELFWLILCANGGIRADVRDFLPELDSQRAVEEWLRGGR